MKQIFSFSVREVWCEDNIISRLPHQWHKLRWLLTRAVPEWIQEPSKTTTYENPLWQSLQVEAPAEPSERKEIHGEKKAFLLSQMFYGLVSCSLVQRLVINWKNILIKWIMQIILLRWTWYWFKRATRGLLQRHSNGQIRNMHLKEFIMMAWCNNKKLI